LALWQGPKWDLGTKCPPGLYFIFLLFLDLLLYTASLRMTSESLQISHLDEIFVQFYLCIILQHLHPIWMIFCVTIWKRKCKKREHCDILIAIMFAFSFLDTEMKRVVTLGKG
jgi:hypothetical protein